MTRDSLARADRAVQTSRPPLFSVPSRPIVVGLVNNMPDAAVLATEAQFRRLVNDAKGRRDVQLKFFFMPEVSRSDAVRADLDARYASVETLAFEAVDALIVTGAEPRAPSLQDEPYWDRLAALVDWAKTGTVSTLWSCLAAHAAVLHLDGVRRRPLDHKCSGVFAVERVDPHALTQGHGAPLLVPHSRVNALLEEDLTKAGYRILTRSAQIGVDAFIREEPSLFVFFQGHPEYDPQSLMLEYRRDVRRFLRRERTDHPNIPEDYFEPRTEARLEALAQQARLSPSRSTLTQGVKIMRSAAMPDRWIPWSTQLYSNWLELIEARRGLREAGIA